MKDILKEIDFYLDMTGTVAGDIDLHVDVIDNATYQRAKKYYKFFGDMAFQKPVIGVTPKDLVPVFANDTLKSLQLTVSITEDYVKGGE